MALYFNSFLSISSSSSPLCWFPCVARERGVGNLLPLARCTRALQGDLVLARGEHLVILDLAAKLAVLGGEMPAVLVDVSRTVRPRGLAMDLRCTRVSGLEGTIDTNPRTNLP